MNEARDRRARLNEWVVHEQFSRRRKEQAERERAKTELGKGHEPDKGHGLDKGHELGQGCKQGEGQGPMQSQEKEDKRKKRNGAHAKGMDPHAYAKLGMQPLPGVVLQASRLLGCGGQYVVFPRTRKKFLRKVNRFIDSFRIGKVLEAGAVITGSFLLHHLMQGAKWHPNDLDLFGTPAALRVAKQLFWGPDVDVSLLRVARGTAHWADHVQDLKLVPKFMCSCPWVVDGLRLSSLIPSDGEPDQVVSYTEWTTLAGFKVKFFCVGGSTVDDVRDTIMQFDLALCRSFFDGRFIYVPRETHAALQVRRAPLTDKDDPVPYFHADNMLQFARKYEDRGFQVDLPSGLRVTGCGPASWNSSNNTRDTLLSSHYVVPSRNAHAWNVRAQACLAAYLAAVDSGKVPTFEENPLEVVLRGGCRE
jgi:hypothetical protein